ncbi:hypothetical protein SAMN04488109_0879 [Chryseolinea serpens]|uniref:WG containing repeat-containing protein n=1 Tax=Chryseolinea serpens TaxID=947013 RepID=A0A1M5KW61_9BACT|nr:WG repeat-containing protein [Chryseolinea serpens]SHG57092.1 hypothetical protein SAMN04488109_0879 [Chryseolinea serpens]
MSSWPKHTPVLLASFLSIFVVTAYSQQETIDSLTTVETHYRNGKIKDRTTVRYIHYYLFDHRSEKYRRRLHCTVRDNFDKRGRLVRRDSLPARDSLLFCEKYFGADGLLKTKIFYEKNAVSPRKEGTFKRTSDYKKLDAYSYDENREVRIEYSKERTPKFEVQLEAGRYTFSSNSYEAGYRRFKHLKYAIVVRRKRYIEVRGLDPIHRTTLFVLKLNASNPLIRSANLNLDSVFNKWNVMRFLTPRVGVIPDLGLITYYEEKLRKTRILDLSFNAIIREPVERVTVLRPPGKRSYLLICQEKCGLFTARGKAIIPPLYDAIDHQGDYLIIRKDQQSACFDYRGNIIIPFRKNAGYHISEDNMAVVDKHSSSKEHGSLLINMVSGDTVYNGRVLSYYNNFGVVYEERGNSVVNAKGEWIIHPNERIRDIKVTSDGMAFIELTNPRFHSLSGSERSYWLEKYELKKPDSAHEKKIDLFARYPDFQPWKYRYVLFNLKTGKIDTLAIDHGVLEENPTYSLSRAGEKFINGYIKIELHPQWSQGRSSFLSLDGEVINLPPRFTKIKSEMNAHKQAIVVQSKKIDTPGGQRNEEFEGVIDASGKVIIPCDFSVCDEDPYGYGYIVYGDSCYGLIDFEGEWLIPLEPRYDDVQRKIREAEDDFFTYSTDQIF